MVQDQYYQNLASTYPLLTRDEEVAIVRGSGGSSSAAAYPARYSALKLTVKLSFVESCQHVDTFGHNTKKVALCLFMFSMFSLFKLLSSSVSFL